MAAYEIIEKHEAGIVGGWHAKVRVGERVLFVGVTRGGSVRIAFKPRGQNIGWKWYGYVRDEQGKTIYNERVSKSAGVHGLLRNAGVIACEHRLPPAKYRGAIRTYCSCGARLIDGVWVL